MRFLFLFFLAISWIDLKGFVVDQTEFTFEGGKNILRIEGDENILMTTINLSNDTLIFSQLKAKVRVTNNAFFHIHEKISLKISNIEFLLGGPGVVDNGLIKSSAFAKNFSIILEVHHK